ncbi:MAG TPA: hypothetical protein VMU48_06190 [Terracidiphilus sp.]|nr:hypothetical protein [Terracidiphilus sp.]
MADLSAPGSAAFAQKSGGPFSPLARGQYAALLVMRWRMFVFGLRSIRGILELGASGIQMMVFSFMGLGLGLGLGFVSYSLAYRAQWQYVAIELWVVLFVWQMVPVALASFQDQFDMSGLLRFPLSFGSFFMLYVVFGLLDVSTILGAMGCLGIFIGVTMARQDLAAWTVLVLLCFAAFNILLARTLLAWVDRWFSQRRTREIASALFLLFLVSLQFLNPALRQERSGPLLTGERQTHLRQSHTVELNPLLKTASVLQMWLPPGLTAETLQNASENRLIHASGLLAAIGLYVVGIGGTLAVRLRAEFRGENLGEAPAHDEPQKRERAWLLDGGGPLSAILEKEFRTLLRSMPQLYALGVPVLMVLVVGSLFRNGATAARHPIQFALLICVAYGLLGFTRLIYNNLGTEGTGIQILFMSPTPIRTVILGKNLFFAVIYGLMAVLSFVLASVRLGWPNAINLTVTAAWLMFALPANLAVGDIFSLTMPYRVNPGRITRQSGFQGNALLSMLVQALLLGLGAAVIAICRFAGREWLAAPILLISGLMAIFAWFRALNKIDEMANERRDNLISILAKAD